MKKTYFLSIGTVIMILFFTLVSGAAAGKPYFEYGELVVVHQNAGKLKSSTTVYFFYGDGKEVRAHQSENSPRGLESRRAAFKEFIESYTQKKDSTAEPSIIAVLNTLGKDGWEMIQFSGQAPCTGNSSPQSTYLFKRQK
ncbi:MAG: hypothetical protein K9L59_00550 [Desulfobacterales bacterium]|nr:hypothetical protein [Desulfobacterales bacterium]